MGVNATDTPKEMFYVRCIGEIGTIVGPYHFNPKEPPVGIRGDDYVLWGNQFAHYEKRGVIAIDKPGSPKYKASALKFRSALDAAENIKAGGELPPEPMVFRQNLIPDAVRQEVAKAAMFSDIDEPETGMDSCIAMTKSGKRCSKKPNKGMTLCNIHIKSIRAGKELESFDGETLTKANI